MEITKKTMKVEAEEQGNSYVRLDYFLSAVALQRREGPIAQEHGHTYGLPAHYGRSLGPHNNENTREYILPGGMTRVRLNEHNVFYDYDRNDRSTWGVSLRRRDATIELKLFGEEPPYLRQILNKAGTVTKEKTETVPLDEVLTKDFSKYSKEYPNHIVAEAEKM